MPNLINGRTQEDIKQALCVCIDEEECEPFSCHYYFCDNCHRNLMRDSLAYIEHLEAERDALLEEVRGDCDKCKHYNKAAYVEPCKSCRKSSGREGFEWRGFKPTKEDEK